MSETPIFLPVVPTPRPAAPPWEAPLDVLRETLVGLDAEAASAFFSVAPGDRLLKSTISLCPVCLEHVPALVVARGGRVLLKKTCPDHGDAEAVVESDERFYRLSNKDRWGRRYAADRTLDLPSYEGPCGEGEGCCGSAAPDGDFASQMTNKTCTVLIEVTNACNLECAVCYSDARGDRKLPFETFRRYLSELIRSKGGLDSVQLTGGEAVLHPEFWRMVEFLYQQPGVKKIYLPTNGILFARDEVAARLAPFRSKVMVLLQFDGLDPGTDRALRQARLDGVRARTLRALGRLGIQTQLTMTISLGVNESEIGEVVDTGLANDHVKVIALQPVTYSGRYDLTRNPLERLTLSDVVKAVAAEVRRRQARAEDFVPIPCSHPNCGWITLFVRRFGVTRNIVRHVDLEKVMDQAANRTLLGSKELRRMVGTRGGGLLARVGARLGRRLIRSKDVFGIAVKPFMDRFSYDLDRVSACCHHILDTKGRPVSFCEYNARIRPCDSWERFPLLRESGA